MNGYSTYSGIPEVIFLVFRIISSSGEELKSLGNTRISSWIENEPVLYEERFPSHGEVAEWKEYGSEHQVEERYSWLSKPECFPMALKNQRRYICNERGDLICLGGWYGEKCDRPLCKGGCGRHGRCVEPGECRCHVGYYGERCEECVPLPGCVHGTCQQAYECTCSLGWKGTYCSQAICSEGCNMTHASCRRPGECICHPGMFGENCDQCIKAPGCVHGTCSKPFECQCKPGWTGIDCDLPICEQECVHGRCRDNECHCKTGWSGDACDSCIVYPGCQHGSCTLPWECNCQEGYRGMFCNITTTADDDTATLPITVPAPATNFSVAPVTVDWDEYDHQGYNDGQGGHYRDHLYRPSDSPIDSQHQQQPNWAEASLAGGGYPAVGGDNYDEEPAAEAFSYDYYYVYSESVPGVGDPSALQQYSRRVNLSKNGAKQPSSSNSSSNVTEIGRTNVDANLQDDTYGEIRSLLLDVRGQAGAINTNADIGDEEGGSNDTDMAEQPTKQDNISSGVLTIGDLIINNNPIGYPSPAGKKSTTRTTAAKSGNNDDDDDDDYKTYDSSLNQIYYEGEYVETE